MAARQGARSRPASERCAAKTKRGTACRRRRAEGQEFCPQHAPGGAHGGRPTKFSEEAVERIVNTIRQGGFAEHAAAASGVSRRTIVAWLERGDPEREDLAPEDEPYVEFRRLYEEAKAAAVMEALGNVKRAMASEWRAAAWYLENADPEQFGRRRRPVSAAARDPLSPGVDAPDPSGRPVLRVVDDQVGPDGRAL